MPKHLKMRYDEAWRSVLEKASVFYQQLVNERRCCSNRDTKLGFAMAALCKKGGIASTEKMLVNVNPRPHGNSSCCTNYLQQWNELISKNVRNVPKFSTYL